MGQQSGSSNVPAFGSAAPANSSFDVKDGPAAAASPSPFQFGSAAGAAPVSNNNNSNNNVSIKGENDVVRHMIGECTTHYCTNCSTDWIWFFSSESLICVRSQCTATAAASGATGQQAGV